MVQKKGFCMTCAMKILVKQSFTPGKRSYPPNVVVKHLKGAFSLPALDLLPPATSR